MKHSAQKVQGPGTKIFAASVVTLGIVTLFTIWVFCRSHTQKNDQTSLPVSGNTAVPPADPKHHLRPPVEPEVMSDEPKRLPKSSKPSLTKIDWDNRRRLLSAILKQINARQTAASSNFPAHSAGQNVRPLDQEYIRKQMKEIVPLVRECYQLALEQNQEIGGELVVEFSIIGDPELGGLVETSQIVAGDLENDKTLSECMRETMYALQLQAPEDGGRLVVRYPFRFRPKK